LWLGLSVVRGFSRLRSAVALDGHARRDGDRPRVFGHYRNARLDTALANGWKEMDLDDLRRRHTLGDGAEKSLLRLRHRPTAAARVDESTALRPSSSRSTKSRRMCMKS